jgi:cell volume regulation protein A
MAAGSEGLGGFAFEDYRFTFRLGTVALVLILFDGGLNTPLTSVREGLKPAALLATAGVVLTSLGVAVGARWFGMSWAHALLLGAIVSSTDAAAVFSVLRGSGLWLRRKVGVTLEVESGINDPMAVILTIAMTQALVSSAPLPWWRVALDAFWQMVIGLGFGLGVGQGGRWLMRVVRLPAAGMYPVLTLALAFLAFGLPTLFSGSGFLAVYVAALLIGNEAIRYRSGLIKVHDAVAWVAQVTMFLMLGMLVFPSELWEVGPMGLAVGLVLAVLVRPLATLLCLVPFQYSWRERAYLSWVGLRGAVPIILATYPVLAGAPGARQVFNIVFFVVVVNTLVPGATVPWLTRALGLVDPSPPPPPAVLELSSTQLLSGDIASFFIDAASAASGASLSELPFPETATAAMIVRGTELLAPKGNTQLRPGDHVYVFYKPEDLPLVRLIFGRPEGE